ncbi:hypothetical protein ACRRTK_016195 [Alexandromys fortis]
MRKTYHQFLTALLLQHPGLQPQGNPKPRNKEIRYIRAQAQESVDWIWIP